MTRDPWYFQRWAFEQTTGNAARKAVLSMLATMADSGSGRCEAKIDTLAKGTEVSERTISGHLRALVEAGYIARREQYRVDRGRRADEFLILAPGVTEWPDGQAVNPPADSSGGEVSASSTTPPSVSGGSRTTTKNGHASKQDDARADEFPEDLPAELHTVAVTAGKILKKAALARGQRREVTRAAVGHAVLTHPDRDHVKVAREVEGWILHGKGAGRSCSDIVARYRNFLANADPIAGPPVAPGSSAVRPSTTSGRLRDMAASLRGDG